MHGREEGWDNAYTHDAATRGFYQVIGANKQAGTDALVLRLRQGPAVIKRLASALKPRSSDA